MDLQINVFNHVCQIMPRLGHDLLSALDLALSFGVPGAEFSAHYREHGWDGKTHLLKVGRQVFPTGFLPEVVDLLRQHGVEPVINDRRAIPKLREPHVPLKLTPWPHQAETISTSLGRTRGLIQSATGSGKTMILSATWGALNVPAVILTQRKELLQQLRDSFKRFLGVEAGVFGGGAWEKGQVTICMVQSLLKATDVKYAKLLKEFEDPDSETDRLVAARKIEVYNELIKSPQFVAYDEVHRAGAGSTYALMQLMENAYWRFGYSATAYGFREDGKDYLIKAAFGDVVAKVTTSDLVDRGVLVPTDIYGINFSHKGRHYPRTSYGEYCDKAVVENEERNKIAIQVAYRMFQLREPVLVAVQRVDHGRYLAKALQYLVGAENAKFVFGEDHSTYRDDTLRDFREGRLPILVSTLISEGFDAPGLRNTVATGGANSRIAVLQLLGRGMRSCPGKTRARFFDIMDQGTRWLGSHSQVRESIYRGERAFTYTNVNYAGLAEFMRKLR